MIYITYDNIYGEGYTGIRKKILGHMQVFRRYFPKVYLTCHCGRILYLMEEDRILDKEMALTKAACNDVLDKWLDKYKIKQAYIRYGLSDKWFIHFLKTQKEKNIKSVLEIPTYPYDGELKVIHRKLEDAYYRKLLYKYIDLVATNFSEKKLWGMRCVYLSNGVDLECNPLHKRRIEKKKLVLIGVSTLISWQGYERIIQGIYNYYKEGGKYDLIFKIVGEGPERGRYCSLVEHYDLQSHVVLCGRLEGMELNNAYDEADIAVSSLGRYKTEIDSFTPIKGAEYCARGIPFICGYHDMRFTEEEEFIMKVPNTPEPIDMNDVIEFYEKLQGQEGYPQKMRDYAANHLTWEMVMKPIIDFLRAGEEP